LDTQHKYQGVSQVHACLEATNTYEYEQAVARALYDPGSRVSMENPARVQGFAQAELSRTQNDSFAKNILISVEE
jgi:hypothetical protein